jgi:hypothetical protein
MYQILDKARVATLITIGAIVGGLVALFAGGIDYQEFLVGIGATAAGAGVLGHARNQAGHGTGHRRSSGDVPPGR